MRPMIIFAFASLFPALLLVLACVFGGVLPLASAFSITVLVFILDRITNAEPSKISNENGHSLSLLIGVAHFVVLATCVWGIAQAGYLSTLDKALIFIGAGLWFGQVSNSNAHELIHRSSRGPRRLGIAIYCSLLFGHHASTHPKVHHVQAATDRDPNSARSGEGFYRFLIRAWLGGFHEGLVAENTARAGAKQILSRWSHPYVGYTAGGILTVSASLVIGGFTGLGALLAIATYAQIQLFLSDYVQHYGLRRKMLESGRFEPIGPNHSWNAPHWYSSAMMLNAPRHSDHHTRPSRSFPSLELDESTMPILPQPLPVMACLALVPNIWRRVMDRRVAKWMAL